MSADISLTSVEQQQQEKLQEGVQKLTFTQSSKKRSSNNNNNNNNKRMDGHKWTKSKERCASISAKVRIELLLVLITSLMIQQTVQTIDVNGVITSRARGAQRGLCSIRLPLWSMNDDEHSAAALHQSPYGAPGVIEPIAGRSLAGGGGGVGGINHTSNDESLLRYTHHYHLNESPRSVGEQLDQEIGVFLFQRRYKLDGMDDDEYADYVDKFNVGVGPHSRYQLPSEMSDEQLRQSRFAPQLATYIIIHGFRGAWSPRSWQKGIKDLILSSLVAPGTGASSLSSPSSSSSSSSSMSTSTSSSSTAPDSTSATTTTSTSTTAAANVLIVDWSRLSRPARFEYDYPSAVSSSHRVGLAMGQFVRRLIEATGADARRFHLIGYSLGAHIAGYIGKAVPNLGRITALDPTGVCYDDEPDEHKLNRNDAHTVIALHTNGRTLGTKANVADYDIWVNGGLQQPGCARASAEILKLLTFRDASFACSHRRAHELMSEPLDTCQHVAYACSSYTAFQQGECGTCFDHTEHTTDHNNQRQADCVMANLAEQISASNLMAWPLMSSSQSSSSATLAPDIPTNRQYHLITAKSSPYCTFQYQILIYLRRRWRHERAQHRPNFQLELVTSGAPDDQQQQQQRHSIRVTHFHSRYRRMKMSASQLEPQSLAAPQMSANYGANGQKPSIRADPRRKRRQANDEQDEHKLDVDEGQDQNERQQDDDVLAYASTIAHDAHVHHEHYNNHHNRNHNQHHFHHHNNQHNHNRRHSDDDYDSVDLMSALLSVEWHEPIYKWLPDRFIAANLSSTHQAALASVSSVHINFMSHSSGRARRQYSTRLCPLDRSVSSLSPQMTGDSFPVSSNSGSIPTHQLSSGRESSDHLSSTGSIHDALRRADPNVIGSNNNYNDNFHDNNNNNENDDDNDDDLNDPELQQQQQQQQHQQQQQQHSPSFLLSLLSKSSLLGGSSTASGSGVSNSGPVHSRLFAISVSSVC